MNNDINWQAEARALAAYLRSRRLTDPQVLTLICSILAASARSYSESDEQVRAAIVRFSANVERMAGLPPATRN